MVFTILRSTIFVFVVIPSEDRISLGVTVPRLIKTALLDDINRRLEFGVCETPRKLSLSLLVSLGTSSPLVRNERGRKGKRTKCRMLRCSQRQCSWKNVAFLLLTTFSLVSLSLFSLVNYSLLTWTTRFPLCHPFSVCPSVCLPFALPYFLLPFLLFSPLRCFSFFFLVFLPRSPRLILTRTTIALYYFP